MKVRILSPFSFRVAKGAPVKTLAVGVCNLSTDELSVPIVVRHLRARLIEPVPDEQPQTATADAAGAGQTSQTDEQPQTATADAADAGQTSQTDEQPQTATADTADAGQTKAARKKK